MQTQRYCKIYRETFDIERKAGRPPRIYCPKCSPAGFQVVKVPGQSRVKLRRRPSLFPRLVKINKGVSVASVVPMRDESA
jgi:hypothetical protein